MTQYIQRLPAVFQTVTEKQFFDATFDQVFSKKDSDYLAGYLGRRNPGSYNPISDFYLPEPNKNRTWWQLEATAFARDEDTTKSNIFFYEDLLDRINYYGGNTLNQDRLFESEYYSFAPPIDYDMFINYQNYYWVEQGLATITITGVMGSDIIGQPSYTTPISATPPNLTLSTGMKIILTDDPLYSSPHTIENMGGCIGIQLVPQFADFTQGTIFEFLPWDSSITLSNGRVIQNSFWDGNTWDTQTQPNTGDYITIERGSLDRNAWSRTNKWYHIDAINKTIAVTGTAFPANATRALRPIIQFVANLILYKSGTQFRDEITYGFRDDSLDAPILLADFQNQNVAVLNATYGTNISDGDLVCFFNDPTVINATIFPWDTFQWDINEWDAAITEAVNKYIFVANIAPDGTVFFYPKTSYSTPILEGDIVFIDENAPYDGAQRGQTWYFTQGTWYEAFNDKISNNQPPLFQLYDHLDIPLDDSAEYPGSTFEGSTIFSYKVNETPGATTDPVLGFPIVYTSLGQSSDIIFQNDLMTDRYTYGNFLPINGYYYYKTSTVPVLYNNWNLYDLCDCADIEPAPPCNCLETSKQRVINQYVVGYGTLYQFELSVTPYGYPATATQTPDLIVSVNGIEIKNAAEQTGGYTFETINNKLYVNLTTYLTNLFTTPQTVQPVVELQTYTHDLLDPASPGYFQIPQQLEANPNQEEIFEISGSNLIQQFASIISNQIGFTGIAFGGNNNYRDSRKNRSVGQYILQNVAPALKSMLVSSSDDLDFIAGERFSQDEYTKFKNRYVTVSQQMINQEFNPVQYYNNSIVVNAWVTQILKTLNISKEFSNAFAYSYMIASGTPTYLENVSAPGDSLVTLTNYIDLSDPKNIMYVYDVTDPTQETLLIAGVDYEIVSSNLTIDVQLNIGASPADLIFYLYQDPLPTYVPSTPTKLGLYGASIPRIELDTSYVIPTLVIIGHDGSKTISYGDYRDRLLLELEIRIYNGIQSRFRNEYALPLRVESVKSGYFRQTRYSRQEYLNITESYLNKWSAKNRANYRINDWLLASQTAPLSELWKLYNYSDAVDISAQPLNLPGNWKGIFQYYYDTYYPDTRPWEMLGFSDQPSWWVSQYGAGVINGNGQLAWPNTLAYSLMWADLEAGIIRQGPSAIYDPITLLPLSQPMWARPGLSAIIPVDAAGDIIPVTTLFGVATSGNPYAPYDGFDADWVYGDGGPVEQAWMCTSGYRYSIQEFLYLMRPAPFGELMWDTLGTELSPGTLVIPGIVNPVMSSINWQYVQNDTYDSADAFFSWMRPKNVDQVVHAESVNGAIQVRFGYQTWISDRLLFLGKDIGSTFGQKVRTLDVNLANKLAGFTNKDTTNTYIESVTPGASTNTLIIPSTNFNVLLHKSPPVKTYAYSGVIIRALADGTFVVYGYDLLNSEFVVLNRTEDKLIDVTIGGTPAEFQYYNNGASYNEGDIVRHNGVYYVSRTPQKVQTFSAGLWTKLKSLPTVGGISVVYKPISATTTSLVPYGTIFNTTQEVFDFLIGWGAYLETQGWQFKDVSTDTNQISDWLASAKQFLFWLNTSWAPDAAIQLSPLANTATLIVDRGYPDDVESLTNGVYSILDKYGVAIAPTNTTVERFGSTVTVSPADLSTGGLYFLQVTASETEHVLIFDNLTNFNDVVYSPLLRARQQRLRFNGFRSNGWYGKMEAPGYLIIDNQLVPNYDTIVDAMRHFYDPDVQIDNPSLEDLGRHLIGYESKSYLDNLQVSNDVQYLFYQGAIRQKGTKQAFDKLFRSTKIQANEIIEVFEEWALKLGDFGNTIEQVSTEFILKPEQNTGEVIVARLNFVPSTIGFVREINILNAENAYSAPPTITIAAPDADPLDPNLTKPLRQATAYAVLGTDNRLSRIDILDPGYGYLVAPAIAISTPIPVTIDVLYSVWQGEIFVDENLDNIIDIDIDQTDVWTVRPPDPSYSLEFPLTDNIVYPTPNAGYVNFNDVTFSRFNPLQTAVTWGNQTFNPLVDNTIWIAKTFTEDWDVYKLVNYGSPFSVVIDDDNNLFLKTLQTDPLITPQSSVTGDVTDFGNMIILQGVDDSTAIPTPTNYTVGFTFDQIQTTAAGDGYNWYNLVTLDGNPITSTNIPAYAEFTVLMLYKTLKFWTTPVVIPSYVVSGDKIWVDQVGTLPDVLWTVYTYNGSTLDIFRQQEPLINSTLFQSATVFNTAGTQIVQLPIYDPFKNILPGAAKQNLTYMTLMDPASYNVTSNPRLFNENITFGQRQVGQLWWDLSDVRYVYYEQPIAQDDSETESENLVYRRDHWGQLFPGSVVRVYEWVESNVPPELYTGSGIPKDVTTYVQLSIPNIFTGVEDVKYFFWALNTTDKPNIENRTLAAVDVTRLLQSPKSQGFSFFAPVQQTAINNSYMFYNVQQILAYQGDHVQIQYRVAERNDQEHTQWSFFREGDRNSLVTSQFWNKFVDSICGYTQVLPVSEEYANGIPVTGGVILPVPDPSLSSAEKFGILYRPRQGMFVKLQAARKVFVQASNSLLQYIPIRDIDPGWDTGVTTNIYWTYTNWYAVGYENSMPTAIYPTLASANTALLAGQLQVDQIIQVTAGTFDGRFTLYAVKQLNPNVSTLSLDQIGIQNSAIKLLNTIYTVTGKYDLPVELRQLLNAFRTTVMIDDYIVDQNELFFSMLNYVLSEQKHPDWLFKSSYIYIKENNLPLSQDQLYIPDQISNIIEYIIDAKPYHTQIRDYTSTYLTTDIAPGTASDFVNWNMQLRFGPQFAPPATVLVWNNYTTYVDDDIVDYLNVAYRVINGPLLNQVPLGNPDYEWIPYPIAPLEFVYAPSYILDPQTGVTISDVIAQYVSENNVPADFDPGVGNPWPNIYTIPLTFYDISKVGLSQLFPYTFSFDSININNPQTFVTPYNIVGVQVGDDVYNYGTDYYVEYNVSDSTYTIYFYNDPGTAITPVALVWFDGGQLEFIVGDVPRSETVYGTDSTDDLVINVDTKLPVNIGTGPITPYVGWGDCWDSVSGPVADAIIAAGGTTEIPWDAPLVVELLDNTVSFKENINLLNGDDYYRNAAEHAGELALPLPAPEEPNGNTATVVVYVDPVTHPGGTDILPDPDNNSSPALWINGERIEYRIKEEIAPDTWALKFIRRSTNGTAATDHDAASTVFVEYRNIMPIGSDVEVWNAAVLPAAPDVDTQQGPSEYTSIENVPLGGIWYSQTPEANFLKDGQGISIT